MTSRVRSRVENFRQGICSNHLAHNITLNFFFGYCSTACLDLLTNPIKFGVNRKRVLCWSILAIEPMAGFCLFMGYLPSKNSSHGHGTKVYFVSLQKPIALCTIRKIILSWLIFALKPFANSCQFFGLLNLKNGPRDHDVKGNLLFMQNVWIIHAKRMDNINTVGKIISCESFSSK